MWPSLAEPALRLADEVVTYGELLLVGADTGSLETAAERTRRGLGALANGGDQPSREALAAEGVAFRRRRRLHSGEDLRAWLGERGLSRDDWEGFLFRSLAVTSPDATWHPPTEESVGPALAVDLACSGWWGDAATVAERAWSASRLPGDEPHPQPENDGALRRRAEELASQVAFLGTLDVEWCAERLGVLHARLRALEEVERRCSASDLVATRIADHAADWMHFEFDQLELPTREAGSEAVMCARDDHLEVTEIARRAGGRAVQRTVRRDELPAGTAARLAGAAPGEVIGPMDDGDGAIVLWLRERRPPSSDDPALCEEAGAELLSEALERAASGLAWPVGPL